MYINIEMPLILVEHYEYFGGFRLNFIPSITPLN